MKNIKAILKDHYNIDGINISPQKGGWAALAYKVSNKKHSYFLKVYEKNRASTSKWTALIDEYIPIIIWFMNNSDLKGKIPVLLLTKSGDYKCEDNDGIYLLFEYIDGETIGDKDLTEEQIYKLSEIITELHLYGEEIPVGTGIIQEDFHVPFLQQLRNVLDKKYDDISNDVKEVIHPHIERMNGLIDTVENLSISLKKSNLKMALCHTDIHNWNLMQCEHQLILIDWEGLRLAPVEADLIFLVNKPYYNRFLSIYKKVHKDFEINSDALQFYQGKRKLEDIWEFIEQLLFDNQDAKERADTIDILRKELKGIDK